MREIIIAVCQWDQTASYSQQNWIFLPPSFFIFSIFKYSLCTAFSLKIKFCMLCTKPTREVALKDNLSFLLFSSFKSEGKELCSCVRLYFLWIQMGTADSQKRITSSYLVEKRFFIHFIALEKGYQSRKEHLQKSFLKIWPFHLKIKNHRHFSACNKLWAFLQLLRSIPHMDIIHLFKVVVN